MKLLDKEVLDKIQDHKLIIITGTTEGRTRMRKLLIDNLGQQRIIDTRNYYRGRWTTLPLVEILSLYHTTKGKEWKVLQIFLDMLQKKKKPVIIDSFTDVQQFVRCEFIRTVGEKMGEHRYGIYDRDWSIYKMMLKSILTKLRKQRKKVILFADLKDETIYKNQEIIDTGYQIASIDKDIIYESDLFIIADCESNLLIKERPDVVVNHINKLTNKK